MYCTNCGAELPDVARFCSQCGGDVNLPPVSDPATRATLGLPVHRTRTARFHGTGGELFGLYLVNALLALVTLGVYWFWGKAKVRRYIFSQVDFDGERFQFHGTGMEMFIGWLKAVGILILAYGGTFALIVVLADSRTGQVLMTLVIFAGLAAFFLFAVPFAIVGTWRYRLSRTSWRGIRLGFSGSAADFVGIWAKGALLSLLTLGLYSPYFLNDVREFLWSRTRFGTLFFRYTGRGSELFPRFLVALCLMLVTLGVYRFWWAAELDRYYWEHTSLGPMRLKSTYDGGGLLGLAFTNYLLIVFTLGIGTPWAIARTLTYRINNLIAEGDVDYAAIRQRIEQASAAGEELGDVLDLDADLGF